MAEKAKRCTFDEWVQSYFGHNPRTSSKCNISVSKEVAYITQAFSNAKVVFASFTNAQVNEGLWYLVSHSSETMLLLLDKRVSWSERERCIRSFYDVFKQLFAARCSPHLSHLDESGDNPLNGVCYMWWDIFPFWGSLTSMPKIDDLFLEVMVLTLKIDSDPCRESALHGLGHIPIQREYVREIINNFLAENPKLRPELREYALRAQVGDIL